MFKKVLIAEDHESTNISVQKTLGDLKILNTDYVFYCDDALNRIQKALKNDDPYDLLITDLSFEKDHNQQKISDGTELIKAVKKEQPDLKVIVFSAENKQAIIKALFKDLAINGYVRKARNDAKDLKLAIDSIYKGKAYMSVDLKQAIKEKNSYELTEYDITIISLLSEGVKQKEIPLYLQKKDIRPAGLSSVEKRLSLIKEVLEFSNNEQLIAYGKDMGLI
ncbi:DNA-binding NarL/FixJ family response regulator [Pedobacter cryoconitis]|uniref:DNA-binding NarL/FixJ family response regulator n=2 Tax=Pedobacter cryoconitis TaxID=188932 RepID=A0A327SYV1_9SPHI|nr:DNA-binding NarL/FixJ family response regulator [Pedobacter cryoconitis]